ncbi:DUF2461 domain-containing protein [Aureibaculum sp. 2210JD6-5]|uniref:DUF2461 domain-containing protein n=1 Tax=Aureibaculum sp. 2210JD6-5 TaxID=3103957 RepID=UPI002AAEC79D|nr:DUF2461 domain-containing protein [Aureibaculum sp. 2210JD6-5]MDY7395037.1 DUF2461 domain-containing protein [Aureibaculum sp. 2210JD6-5]
MATTIPQKAITFFKTLEKNNNREWFNEHKPEFKAIEVEVKQFYKELLKKLQEHDEVDKLKMFRIYRDVRFSKNKDPYKTHFGGSYNRVKPKLRGGYYVHIAPGDSFIATGFWQPAKEDLFRIRKEFELDATEIRAILKNKKFNQIWGDFVGEEVKTAPKGFSKEHENIDLIRKKQFIFTKKYTDKEVTSPDFINEVNSAFKAIRPYFDYMSEVLTTDLNGVSLID